MTTQVIKAIKSFYQS